MSVKINLEIQINNFPIGKVLKCHFYIQPRRGEFIDREKISVIVNTINFNEHFEKRYNINTVLLQEVEYAVRLPEGKNHDIIYTDSYSDWEKPSEENKDDNKAKKEDKKPKKSKAWYVLLSKFDENDIDVLEKRIETEKFKRAHNLTNEKYNFYVINKEYIQDVDNFDALYELYKDDPYRLKKDIIRNRFGL